MKLCLRHAIPVIATVALTTLIAQAKINSFGGSTATFDAAGPGGLNIHGSTPDLSAAEQDGKVVVTVKLANLTTGIALRDDHMRNTYLEVGRYPAAVVTVPRGALKFPSKGADASEKVAGTMTIHGVTKETQLAYSAAARGDKIAVDGSADIDLRDFGIQVPSYLGVGVDPHVKLKVHFKVTDH